MAFGGVATGSMKAHVAASAAGTSRDEPRDVEPDRHPPSTGRNAAAVAVLLVTSVSSSTRPPLVPAMSSSARSRPPGPCSSTWVPRDLRALGDLAGGVESPGGVSTGRSRCCAASAQVVMMTLVPVSRDRRAKGSGLRTSAAVNCEARGRPLTQ